MVSRIVCTQNKRLASQLVSHVTMINFERIACRKNVLVLVEEQLTGEVSLLHIPAGSVTLG